MNNYPNNNYQMNHSLACSYLGLNISPSMEDIKKAYINACKMYHPDNVGSDSYIAQFNLCQNAYNYLINENNSMMQPTNTSNNNQVNYNYYNNANRASKIIGSAGSKSNYSYNHNAYVKKQKAFKKNSEEKKIRELNEMIEKSKQLQNNKTKLEHVDYKRAEGILDQLRWLRVAQIIHDTIEEDKKKANKGEN